MCKTSHYICSQKKNKQTMTQVQSIFNYIGSLNPSISTISSIGNFVSSNDQQLSDAMRREVMNALPNDTLAYSIATTANKFSAKQLWVIAFQLEKNAEFCNVVNEFYAEIKLEREVSRAVKSAKRAQRRESKKQAEAIIASNIEAFNNVGNASNVNHSRFGNGYILSEDATTITVMFEQHGEKKLVKAYAQLTSI